jgi:fumarate reductase subunit C
MAHEYRRTFPVRWWLTKPTYLLFMVRELTSVFVAGFAVFLLGLVARADDLESFGRLFAALQSPVSVILQLIVLAMVVLHTVTWINLTPKVLVLWWADEQVNPRLVAAANYAAWLVLSAVIAWFVLR